MLWVETGEAWSDGGGWDPSLSGKGFMCLYRSNDYSAKACSEVRKVATGDGERLTRSRSWRVGDIVNDSRDASGRATPREVDDVEDAKNVPRQETRRIGGRGATGQREPQVPLPRGQA